LSSADLLAGDMRQGTNAVKTKMLKGLSAILLAGVSAGFIVGFVTEPERAAAAATPATKPRNEQTNPVVQRAVLVAATTACTQTWPYYEQSCLRDDRRAGDAAPAARVISFSHPAKAPVKPPVSPVKTQVSKVAKLAGGTR
jgi:hypothetical protein